jgi:hypothetical protein
VSNGNPGWGPYLGRGPARRHDGLHFPNPWGGAGSPSPPGAPLEGPHKGGFQVVRLGQTQTILEKLSLEDLSQAGTLCLVKRDTGNVAGEPLSTAPSFDAPCIAILEFGSGPCAEICQVDWLNGTLISLPTCNVNVKGFYPDSGIVLGIATAPVSQTLGAWIAPYPRGASAGQIPMARFSQRLVLPGMGAVVGVVPNRAQSVALLTDNPGARAAGAFTLLFRTTASATPGGVGVRVIAADRALDADEIPLPNGTRSVEVDSTVAVSANIILSYGIAL